MKLVKGRASKTQKASLATKNESSVTQHLQVSPTQYHLRSFKPKEKPSVEKSSENIEDSAKSSDDPPQKRIRMKPFYYSNEI